MTTDIRGGILMMWTQRTIRSLGRLCVIFALGFGLWGCVGSGGGSCGETANGEACETDEDCACGLKCSTVCTEVFGQPTQPIVPPDDTDAPLAPAAQSAVGAFCNNVANLPCVPEDAPTIREDCTRDLEQAAREAQAAGCGAQFQAIAQCTSQHVRCAADGEGLDQDHQENSCPTELENWLSCRDRCENEKGFFCDVPNAMSGTCVAGAQTSCDQTSVGFCEPVEDSEGKRWRCRCAAGPQEGHIFDVFSEECCDASYVVEQACGTVPFDPNDDPLSPPSMTSMSQCAPTLKVLIMDHSGTLTGLDPTTGRPNSDIATDRSDARITLFQTWLDQLDDEIYVSLVKMNDRGANIVPCERDEACAGMGTVCSTPTLDRELTRCGLRSLQFQEMGLTPLNRTLRDVHSTLIEANGDLKAEVIVFTDGVEGDDPSSTDTSNDVVLDLYRAAGVSVNFIHLQAREAGPGPQGENTYFQQLAEQTGGTYLFVPTEADILSSSTQPVYETLSQCAQ